MNTEAGGRNEGRTPWWFRRRVISLTLIVCAAAAAYAMSFGPEMVAAAFPHLAWIVSFTLGAGVFGAVVEDIWKKP